ncbi:MAG: hypothetical protein ACFFFH_11780 [Candidatus Thorarchaeota archaeon]
MSTTSTSPLSPNLIGVWSIRARSNYERFLQFIHWITTFLTLLLILIDIIIQISLVPVAAFLISTSLILTLEFYMSKHPEITVPISQGAILAVASYLYFYNLSQQIGFFDRPSFPLVPNLFGIILGIIILIRTLIGLQVIKLKRWHQNARTPLSHYQEESLTIFRNNLLLSSNITEQEFCDELPQKNIKRLFLFILFTIGLLFLLLIPLWLNIFFSVIIYPYIFLIPGVFISLFLILYISSLKKS